MTQDEFNKQFSKTVAALWPQVIPDGKEEKLERARQLWGMFNSYTLDAATKAVRKTAIDHPTPPAHKSWMWILQQARDLLPSRKRQPSAPSTEDRIREHRVHYAEWAHRGWKYPGDDFIRRCVERSELTPLQVHVYKQIGECCREASRGIRELTTEG